MAKTSAIEWTQATWNPWRGCHKVSAGCKNCYMFRDQTRYGNDPNVVVRSKTTFNDPLKWAKDPNGPRLVFTCSWSDFFIKEADMWRGEAWEIITRTPEITYQILTKRPERIAGNRPYLFRTMPSNVWLGISVETADEWDRADALRPSGALVNFLSLEPLLGPLPYIPFLPWWKWVIVGGESGPNARPMKPEWVRSIRDQCIEVGVPFFFKQWGGNRKINGVWGGRELDGRTWDEMPEVYNV